MKQQMKDDWNNRKQVFEEFQEEVIIPKLEKEVFGPAKKRNEEKQVKEKI